MLTAGIVGLPNVGKSTLFNAVTQTRKAMAANYRFCTIEPNTGVVTVPDSRLEVLSKLSGSQKIIPAVFEFVEKRKVKQQKAAKSGDKKALAEVELLDKLAAHLDTGKTIVTLDLSDDE